MLINNSYNVQVSEEVNETGFDLELNSVAFSALMDTMYKFKAKSIVRELSSNAYDSHLFAGNLDKKFDVYCPSFISPEFKIRDYGTGMSESEILGYYRVMFASTKRGSKDAIGGYGLGSKSPFSYTDQFKVVSYQNGIAKTYTAFKNKDGRPAIVKMFESVTDEQNGLEVSFPVNKEDFNEFAEAISYNYIFYKNKPNVYGVLLATDNVDVETLNDEGVLILKESVLRSGVYAVIENVYYKIDEVFSNLRLCVNNIIFTVENGKVDLQPSRESLSYSDKTKKYILNRFFEILLKKYEDIQKSAQGMNENQKNVLKRKNELFFKNSFSVEEHDDKILEVLDFFTYSTLVQKFKRNHVHAIYNAHARFKRECATLIYKGLELSDDFQVEIYYDITLVSVDMKSFSLNKAAQYLTEALQKSGKTSKGYFLFVYQDCVEDFCEQTSFSAEDFMLLSDYYIKKTGVLNSKTGKNTSRAEVIYYSPSGDSWYHLQQHKEVLSDEELKDFVYMPRSVFVQYESQKVTTYMRVFNKKIIVSSKYAKKLPFFSDFEIEDESIAFRLVLNKYLHEKTRNLNDSSRIFKHKVLYKGNYYEAKYGFFADLGLIKYNGKSLKNSDLIDFLTNYYKPFFEVLSIIQDIDFINSYVIRYDFEFIVDLILTCSGVCDKIDESKKQYLIEIKEDIKNGKINYN